MNGLLSDATGATAATAPFAAPAAFTDAQLRHVGGLLLGAEVAVALALMLAVLVAGALGHWRRTRRERQLAAARGPLAALLTGDDLSMQEIGALERIPRGAREPLVLEFGRTMSGAAVQRLALVGRALGLVEQAERRCQSRFWWRRLAGARVLGTLDHDCAALRRLLDDPHPTVRVEVLHWAARRRDAAVIDSLVARLADPARLCRFTVRDSLLRVGAPATVALERFLRQERAAPLVDALLVARGLGQPSLLPAAVRLARHPDATVRSRAAGVLGTLGGEHAGAALLRQLHDHEWTVREAAARALGEISHWGAASELALRLHDESFPVRREAALSLRRLGGVGMLMLRRARTDGNSFAADMATQVLDLPNSVFRQVAA